MFDVFIATWALFEGYKTDWDAVIIENRSNGQRH